MKIETTKAIVNNVTGYSIGAATTVFFSAHRRHSDNAAVDFAIDVATFVTVLSVGGTVHEPVRRYTDSQVEAVYAFFAEIKSKKTPKK